MTLVADASAVVAALVDDGPEGRWAEAALFSAPLAAPHLLPAEVTGALRRAVASGVLSEDAGTLAHRDLLALPIAYFPYEPFAERAWALRENVTAYDAWYVALAEHLDAPVATLDHRLSRSSGPRCEFALPPDPPT